MAFAEFSRNPDVAKRIKGFFALAPVTSASHIKGLIKLLSDIPELQVRWLEFNSDVVGKSLTTTECSSYLNLSCYFGMSCFIL